MRTLDTPVVDGAYLRVTKTAQTCSCLKIRVGSDSWWHWLAAAACFVYRPFWSLYHLCVWREQRQCNWYWFAQLDVDLPPSVETWPSVYLGQASSLDLYKLDAALHHLTYQFLLTTLP